MTRMVSNFELRKRLQDSFINLYDQIKDMSLETFLDREDLYSIIANRATRLLGGKTKETESGKLIPDLSKAIERLHEFDFVGITEHFPKSTKILSNLLGFQFNRINQKINVLSKENRYEGLNTRLIKKIKDINWMDVEIYEEGLRRFSSTRS